MFWLWIVWCENRDQNHIAIHSYLLQKSILFTPIFHSLATATKKMMIITKQIFT